MYRKLDRGELRKKIMEDCPEEFEETLKDWIDDLEQLISNVVSGMEISNIDEIGKLEDAYTALDEIYSSLY